MVQELIEAGLRQHQAGRLAEAKNIYEQVLASEPQHPDALHLLGVVALQSGDAGGAQSLIEQAIELQPGNPGFHANLARAYLGSQRLTDAHAAFLRAAALDPHEPRFALGAANCLAMQGSLGEAEAQLRQLVQWHPVLASAWFNLGNVVREQARHEEAVEIYRRALSLEPQFPDAHISLGGALHALERFDEAEREYREALALSPDSAPAYCNLASVLIDVGRFEEAAAACEEGIARAPASVDLLVVLGSAHAHRGNFVSALRALRTATEIAPDHARAAAAYATALHETGGHEQAVERVRRALELQPDSTDLRYFLAGACLSAGELQAGWAEYASRPARQRPVAGYRQIDTALDLPEDLRGKRVCLLREQGLGDELFFLRFVAELKARGASVVYRAEIRLRPFFDRVSLIDRVIGDDEPIPDVSVTMLLGDLPRALGQSPSSSYPARAIAHAPSRTAARARRIGVFFPEVPPPLALAPLPDELARAQARLKALGPPPYVGVTWRAGTPPDKQRGTSWSLHKQIPLSDLGATLRGAKATFLALQRNPEPGEIAALGASIGGPVHDLSELNMNLEAMLAVLASIDDYVGVSNTNMHLRAAAGRTARVLVPRPSEWRWMSAGDASPWFPGFRIYRQELTGEWRSALSRLARDLAAR